jgi:putative tryptophan/tyrosine transport system substrate-binding protein
MKRREFIAFVGGAMAWPIAGRAQAPERMRRIGVLLALARNDSEGQARMASFREALEKLGWTEGRNLQLDDRWPGADAERIRRDATELVALQPDVIFLSSQPAFDAMREATSTIPIVFVQVTDPVVSGLVKSLARPGGNITGVSNYGTLGSKLIELLREIAPGVIRAAVIHIPESASNLANVHAMKAAAATVGMELVLSGVHDGTQIERAIRDFARGPSGGLIVLASPTVTGYRDRIIALAAEYRLPAVYAYRYFVADGGLASYGADNKELYRLGATYVGRILRGAKPGDLPIQQPTKLELVLNLRTAKALGLTVPPSLLARADEVIE